MERDTLTQGERQTNHRETNGERQTDTKSDRWRETDEQGERQADRDR